MKRPGSPVWRFSTERAGTLPARKAPARARRSGRARAGTDAGAEPLPRGGMARSVPWVRFNVFGGLARVSC